MVRILVDGETDDLNKYTENYDNMMMTMMMMITTRFTDAYIRHWGGGGGGRMGELKR